VVRRDEHHVTSGQLTVGYYFIVVGAMISLFASWAFFSRLRLMFVAERVQGTIVGFDQRLALLVTGNGFTITRRSSLKRRPAAQSSLRTVVARRLSVERSETAFPCCMIRPFLRRRR
jgi:hypothetical protein